jgi:hypothetical protein
VSDLSSGGVSRTFSSSARSAAVAGATYIRPTSLFCDEKCRDRSNVTIERGANQVPLCGGAKASVRRPSGRGEHPH